MKRFVSLIVAALLLLSMTAMAETVVTDQTATAATGVPSKTTTDNTAVEKIESVSGVEIEETFAIVVTEDAKPVVEEITNLYTYVAQEKKAPVTYFPEETKTKIIEVLIAKLFKADPQASTAPQATADPQASASAAPSTDAETVNPLESIADPEILEKLPDIEQMEINEFITIEPIEYKEEYGDIKTNFTFVTEYKVEQMVVVLIGAYTGEVDENGQFIVEWIVLDAVVEEDGSLSVVIPQADMLKMQEAASVAMAVLSEKIDVEELDDLSDLTELTDAE